jgi:hypothetical protein
VERFLVTERASLANLLKPTISIKECIYVLVGNDNDYDDDYLDYFDENIQFLSIL